MSTRIGDMAIYLKADTGQLASGLKRAGDMVLDFGARSARSMSGVARDIADSQAKTLAALKAGLPADVGWAGRLRDTFGGIAKHAAGDLLAGGIRSAAGGLREMVATSLDLAKASELSAMKFEVMLGSAEKAAGLIGDLKGFAAASPLSLADASQQAVRLLSAGIDRDQITPTLRALTEIAGGDPKQVPDAVRAYTQVKATGRLQGDEWNQFANLGTINYADLAKVLKRDNGRQLDETEVKKYIEAGKVGFEDLGKAIKLATEEGGRFHGLTEKYGQTYAGQLDKMKDSWDELKRGLGEGLMRGLDLKETVGDMARLAEKGKDFGRTLGEALRIPKKVLAESLGVVADVTSALYKFGQKAAAWTMGELGTFRKGEAAGERMQWVDTRTSQLQAEYGLNPMDAYDLFHAQENYLDAQKRKGQAESGIDAHRQFLDLARKFPKEDAGWQARILGGHAGRIAQHERDAAAEAEQMRRLGERSAEIVKRGDPSKITRDPATGKLIPPKPKFDPRLTDLAAGLNDKFADPIKKFRDDLADLTKLRDAGKLDAGVYEQATFDLKRGLEERAAGLGGGPTQLAQAAELGSRQLASLVAQATAGQGNGSDVPALLEQIKQVLERQARDTERILDYTRQPEVVYRLAD